MLVLSQPSFVAAKLQALLCHDADNVADWSLCVSEIFDVSIYITKEKLALVGRALFGVFARKGTKLHHDKAYESNLPARWQATKFFCFILGQYVYDHLLRFACPSEICS